MSKVNRQIILDTETTGLEPERGHRIIEIGCVELINRRFTDHHFHVYLNPERDIEFEAKQVHGLTIEFLRGKPRFSDIYESLLNYLSGAELIIHNAPFDVSFLNHELQLLQKAVGKIEDYCTIIDTLVMARKLHPGQRNSLDALCKRYEIDNSARDLHGGLVDAKLLALTYLAMTSGQDSLIFAEQKEQTVSNITIPTVKKHYSGLRVLKATPEELVAHEHYLSMIESSSGKKLLWGTQPCKPNI